LTLFITSVFSGLAIGGTYALIALGIVLAYRATGVFTFAHGELVALGAFAVAAWSATHGSVLAIAAALLLPAAIAGGFYLVALRRQTGSASHFTGVIATLGLASVLDGVLVLMFPQGDYSYSFPGVPTGVTRIFGTRIVSAQIILAVTAFVVAVSLGLILRYTHFGKILFAAGQDPLLASQGGINIRMVQVVSWTLSGLLAGVAGIAYAATHQIDPSLTGIAFAAFPAIILGGLDSVFGAVVGGFAIGLLQGFVTTYLGPSYVNLITYSLLLLVLLVLPSGLFGTRQVRRV
jgi:branched-chain amino acid transport system permease protein